MYVFRSPVLLLGLCPGLVALAAAEGKLRELPSDVAAAALDLATGDVAIASASGNQVWVLPSAWFDDPTVKPVGPLGATTNPVSLLFKRHGDRTYLVVACFDGAGIFVLDAATREVVAEMPRTPESPKILVSASDDSQDPWIYVTGADGNNLRLDAFQIDQPAPLLGRISTPTRTSPSFAITSGGFVTSTSGDWLYGVDEGRRTITRWNLHAPKIASEFPRAKYVTRVIATACEQRLVRLPLEQGLAQGNARRLSDLRLVATPLPLLAACALNDRPLVVGLANRELQVASLDTGKLVANAELPSELKLPAERTITLRSAAQTHRHTVRPIVLADESRDRIVVLADRQAYTQSIATLNLPVGPIVIARVDVPASVAVAENVAIPVTPLDPRVEVELLSGPDGMRLSGDRLVWRPKFVQLGRAKFSLQLRSGEATVKQDYALDVQSHTVRCPFPAQRVALDDTGTHLVVWHSPTAREVAVIDLATRTTVVTRTLSSPIIAAAMTGERVCVLTATGRAAALSLLDANTLETKEEYAVKIESTGRYLEHAAILLTDETAVIQTQAGIEHRYSLPNPGLSKKRDSDTESRADQLLTDPQGFLHIALLPQSADRKLREPRQALIAFQSRELRSPPDPKQRYAPVVCDAYPVRLGVQLVPESIPGYTRIDLVARPFEREEVIHRWPIDLIELAKQTRDLQVSWSVNGAKAVVLLNGLAYVKDLTEMPESNLPEALRLQPQEASFVAKLDGPTRLQYSLAGGKPPYALGLMLPVAAGTPPQSAWASRVKNTEALFNADVAGYVKDQLARIALSLINWSQETASADAIMTAYVDTVAERFEKIAGHQPTGVPVAILVVVHARDAEGRTNQLNHYLLADLPRDMLDVEVSAAVAKRWPGTVVAAEAAARVAASRGSSASSPLVQFSQALRHGVAPLPRTREQLAAAAQDALLKCEQRWQQILDKQRVGFKHPLRDWADASGNSAHARFEMYFAGQVIVTSERGESHTFSFEKLSASDQAYVRHATAPPDLEMAAARDAQFTRETQLRQIAVAAHNFHDTYRLFPPPAFVADDGRATISWRVMLLPYVGGKELYGLFRLDEPWDSDHNKLLADYMPSIYHVPDVNSDLNRTSIVRPAGVNTVATLDQKIAIRDIIDGTSNTLFAAIANAEHAVVWTQPEDLSVDQDGQFSEHLRWHEGKALVVMCDANLRSVKQTTSREAWHRAAIRNDGQPTTLETD